MSYAIIGMQYGSEAKGALAGYLALQRKPDVVVCNFSPNAGHTFRQGEYKLVTRQLPIGGYISPGCQYILLGPGSVINPETLAQEMDKVGSATVICHPHAAVVTQYHMELESDVRRQIGSTGKGAGQAAIQRIQRLDGLAPVAIGSLKIPGLIISEDAYHEALWGAREVQVEGCQGYSLSMYHGMYPYTTSRDCTIHQLKADVGWHGNAVLEVYGAIRTYPIRVAGPSGPCYGDQRETTWTEVGVEPEITTVTKKERRVFTFSLEQVQRAQMINGCDALYLSFCDYMETRQEEFNAMLDDLTALKAPINWLSFGPDVKDMYEVTREGIGNDLQDGEKAQDAAG